MECYRPVLKSTILDDDGIPSQSFQATPEKKLEDGMWYCSSQNQSSSALHLHHFMNSPLVLPNMS